MDRPEARKCTDSRDSREYNVLDKQRNHGQEHTDDKEYRPASLSEMILTFDDYRMKHTDSQEGRNTNYEATEIHKSIAEESIRLLSNA